VGPTLFDAAAYLQIRLGNLGIAPRQIAEVILSHVHEDHLAGLPELLLMSGKRVRLLTSTIVYHSLLRVLGAMLDLPEAEVSALFDYYPLNPGQPLTLDGRRFESLYAVHSIPTIAVRVNGLYYSGDMRYDESWFDDLVRQGVLSDERRQELIRFADGAEVMVQDAGGGPVHTTITPEVLKALATKTRRLILAHTSQDALPALDTRLRSMVEIAVSGYVSGVGDKVDAPEDAEKFETLSACPLFARLPLEKRVTLARDAKIYRWQDNEMIIRDGELSDGRSYVIHSGLVDIHNQDEVLMTLGRGRSIGERGALQGGYRTNNLIARGPVQLLGFDIEDLRETAVYLGLPAAFDRADWLWQQELFQRLPWSTLLDLALDFHPQQYQAGQWLFHYGEPGYECYLLVSGAVAIVNSSNERLGQFSHPGDFFGGRAALYNTLRNASAYALEASEVWALSAADLQRWQMVYTNILLHLRVVESGRGGERPLAYE
jgi:CRP-like cAMP-binding protein/ribonuclease BN (tRNA processing enzyme)